jgi:uncharacterized protein (DUF433 family)
VKLNSLITTDPEILGGTPVFAGTRVPVESLFKYLERNYTLDEFLECFPTVTRDMAVEALATIQPGEYRELCIP